MVDEATVHMMREKPPMNDMANAKGASLDYQYIVLLLKRTMLLGSTRSDEPKQEQLASPTVGSNISHHLLRVEPRARLVAPYASFFCAPHHATASRDHV